MHSGSERGGAGRREAPPWARGGRGRHGMGMWGGPMRGGWSGERRRMRRGDIRAAILTALVDGPAHGYEVMHRLEERSGGLWRPSPGSVYPTLQMLEDEGLVRVVAGTEPRTFELTDQGRQEAEAAAERFSGPPWARGDENGAAVRDLRDACMQTLGAAKQLANVGGPDQLALGTEIVQRARKELYQLLAEE